MGLLYLADVNGNNFRVRDLATGQETILSAPLPRVAFPNDQTPFVGAGVAAHQQADGSVELFYLFGGLGGTNDGEVTTLAYNELYRAVVTPGSPTSGDFQFVNKFVPFTPQSGGKLMTSLAYFDDGSAGGNLYTTITPPFQSSTTDTFFHLARLNPATGTVTPIMDFTLALEGAMAAAPDRGSLFLFGGFNEATVPDNSDRGDSQTPVFSSGPFGIIVAGGIMEFDPRPNALYLKTVIRDATGQLNVTPDTVLGPGVPANPLALVTRVNGMSYVDGKLQVAVDTLDTGGNTGSRLVTINPSATGAAGNPIVTNVDLLPAGISGLGEISIGTAAPSVTLANPAGGIDTTSINALFARMAYSQQALDSGLVTAAFVNHFLATSQDPAGCAQSNLLAMLPARLQAHVDQTSGIGRTAFDLRSGLTTNHPCAPARGQTKAERQIAKAQAKAEKRAAKLAR